MLIGLVLLWNVYKTILFQQCNENHKRTRTAHSRMFSHCVMLFKLTVLYIYISFMLYMLRTYSHMTEENVKENTLYTFLRCTIGNHVALALNTIALTVYNVIIISPV